MIGNEHLVLTKSGDPLPDIESRTRLVGTLKPIDDELQTELIDPLKEELPANAGDRIYPYYLDMIEAENKIYWVIGLVSSTTMTGIGLWLSISGISGLMPVNNNHFSGELRHYTSNQKGDVQRIIQHIEKDFSLGSQTIGDAQISKQWLYQNNGNGIKVMRVHEMIWLTSNVVTIRGSITHHLIVRDRHGAELDITVSPSEYEPGKTYLKERAPWIIIGGDAATHQLWKKNRAVFIRKVDERRNKLRDSALESIN